MSVEHPSAALPDLPLIGAPLRVVGHVRCPLADEEVGRARRHLVSTIEVLPACAEALLGIEDYSQLFVLFWMDRAPPDPPLLTHPRGDRSLPAAGVFANRGRARPNPIGLAVVDLLERRGAVLTVRRLDAWDGTPVIDLKPYDHYDVHPDPRVPAWFRQRLAP